MFNIASQPHEPSWYAATANERFSYPSLEGGIEADVCVIGAGLTGISAALNLAERGLSVVVLEASKVGWGASGRNGGQMIAGYACGIDTFGEQMSESEVQAIWRMGQETIDIIRQRVDRHSIDCDLTFGYLHAANKPRDETALRASRDEAAKRFGYDRLSWVAKQEMGQYVQSERYLGGLHDLDSGHLQPLNYTLGLARAARSAGVRIFENSYVTALDDAGTRSAGSRATGSDRSGAARPGSVSAGVNLNGTDSLTARRHRVSTRAGHVDAEFVVLACNAYLGQLAPATARKIMPVGTYVIATEPLGAARGTALMPANAAVCDSRFVLDYFRMSPDHRMLWGGKVSYSTMQPPNLAQAMRRDMLKTFPQLEDVKIEYAWGGFCDITMNRAPHFGRLSPTVYFAQGFSGHGVNTTGLAGQLIAEAIAGQAGRFDLFARLEHRDFPGGALLRTPALVLAMAWYRLRDWL